MQPKQLLEFKLKNRLLGHVLVFVGSLEVAGSSNVLLVTLFAKRTDKLPVNSPVFVFSAFPFWGRHFVNSLASHPLYALFSLDTFNEWPRKHSCSWSTKVWRRSLVCPPSVYFLWACCEWPLGSSSRWQTTRHDGTIDKYFYTCLICQINSLQWKLFWKTYLFLWVPSWNSYGWNVQNVWLVSPL